MAGAGIEYRVDDDQVRKILQQIQKRLGDLTPAMKKVGSTVRSSIVRNFEKGGRPVKWAKHSETTKKRRGTGAKILRQQGFAGGLMGSVKYKASRDRVVIGTNKEYGAVHQFGAKKGSFGRFVIDVGPYARRLKGGKTVQVKKHQRNVKLPWGDIPARPFIMVQDEDWKEIKTELNEYVIMGRA